jgi:hypothetical protein
MFLRRANVNKVSAISFGFVPCSELSLQKLVRVPSPRLMTVHALKSSVSVSVACIGSSDHGF